MLITKPKCPLVKKPIIYFVFKIFQISSTFLVPRPTLIGISWKSLVRPFTLPVWGAVAFSLFLFPVGAWTTARLHLLLTQERISAKKSNLIDKLTIKRCIYYTMCDADAYCTCINEKCNLRTSGSFD